MPRPPIAKPKRDVRRALLAALAGSAIASPAGNVTGLSSSTIDYNRKQVELLKSLVPALTRLAFLANPANSSHAPLLRDIQESSQALGIAVLPMHAQTPEELRRSFAA